MFAEEPSRRTSTYRVGMSPVNAWNSWLQWAWSKEPAPPVRSPQSIGPAGSIENTGGGEAVGAGHPLRRDADELLEPLCPMSAPRADSGTAPAPTA